MNDLAKSYALCQRQARNSRSNFYYCFYLLPRAKRLAMCALYAFLRRVDDIGDETAAPTNPPAVFHSTHAGAVDRLARLDALRTALHGALRGNFVDPLFPALADTVARFQIPPRYLDAVIDGVEMDLAGRGYESFADLEQYCHRVASVVGQACIHIWGYSGALAIDLAGQCGLAFQLTNILRDLLEDAERGRIYLPAEDLRRFRYTADELCAGTVNDRFRALLRFEIERAEGFYRAAAGLHPYLGPDGRRIYYAMFHTYRRLLHKIRCLDGGALEGRVRLAGWEKLRAAAESLVLPMKWQYSVSGSGPLVS